MRVGDAERSNHRDTLIGNPTKDLCGIVTHASHITRHTSRKLCGSDIQGSKTCRGNERARVSEE